MRDDLDEKNSYSQALSSESILKLFGTSNIFEYIFEIKILFILPKFREKSKKATTFDMTTFHSPLYIYLTCTYLAMEYSYIVATILL